MYLDNQPFNGWNKSWVYWSLGDFVLFKTIRLQEITFPISFALGHKYLPASGIGHLLLVEGITDLCKSFALLYCGERSVLTDTTALLLQITSRPMVPDTIVQALTDDFKVRQQCTDFTVHDFTFAAGGCINNGGCLSTSEGDFFLKWNSARRFPGLFVTEAKGLRVLSAANCIPCPEVLWTGQRGDYAYILMEYMASAAKIQDYWEKLGQALAALHRNTQPGFGLDHDNYIGSLPQSNRRHTNWLDFFVQERLQKQLALAEAQHKVTTAHLRQFERLYARLPSLLEAEEPPALLHGDLWSGNLIHDPSGMPCLIDPAVYYGHREAELAFTTLFGGFDAQFYASYQEAFPMLSGYLDRWDIYNLYPLLVHVNLFGGGYLHQVESILRNFV